MRTFIYEKSRIPVELAPVVAFYPFSGQNAVIEETKGDSKVYQWSQSECFKNTEGKNEITYDSIVTLSFYFLKNQKEFQRNQERRIPFDQIVSITRDGVMTLQNISGVFYQTKLPKDANYGSWG